jgi:glutamate synthase (NADPH/NADH) large chain
MLSGEVAKKHGHAGLPEDTIHVTFTGTAGQSFGAFLSRGVSVELIGDGNDYVGKGLSGGIIVVRPLSSSSLVSNRNTIIGNTVLYGATAGRLFAAGQAGERFAVRNSGAETVVEGCGSNGCEYMTGGTAVILGAVGHNFGAGMTGGMAFVYDENDSFMQRVNKETLTITRVGSNKWADKLRALVEEHVGNTQSRFAERLLNDWDRQIDKFWHVVPNELAALIAREEAEKAPQRA